MNDPAASRPFDDFDINAGGTLNLLEAVRQHVPHAPFVHMSTNKVLWRPAKLHPASGTRYALGL